MLGLAKDLPSFPPPPSPAGGGAMTAGRPMSAGHSGRCTSMASGSVTLTWDLYNIRRQLVELARAHHTSVIDIVLRWIVITEQEWQQVCRKAAKFAPACPPSSDVGSEHGSSGRESCSKADSRDDSKNSAQVPVMDGASLGDSGALSTSQQSASRMGFSYGRGPDESLRAGLMPWWPQPPSARRKSSGYPEADPLPDEDGDTAGAKMRPRRSRPRRKIDAAGTVVKARGASTSPVAVDMRPGSGHHAARQHAPQESMGDIYSHLGIQVDADGRAVQCSSPDSATAGPGWSQVAASAQQALLTHTPHQQNVTFAGDVEPTSPSLDGRSASLQSASMCSMLSQGECLRPANNQIQSLLEDVSYGIELETFVVKDFMDYFVAVKEKVTSSFLPFINAKLPELGGVLFEDYETSKADVVYNKWKVTTDASIQSEDGRPIFGFEVVSRICHGWRGIRECKKVARVMRLYGCATNNTTALHVHVSCRSLSDDQMKRFAQFYCVFESVIDEFHAYPRRKDHSRYCRSIVRSVDIGRDLDNCIKLIDEAGDCAELCKVVNPQLTQVVSSGRNHKVNFQHLVGTHYGDAGRRIEFRQHAGTCDGEEIGMWVRFVSVFTYQAALQRQPPDPRNNNEQALWSLLGDDILRVFFTRKKETLPARPSGFTFAARELFQGCDNQWLI
eukprot:TRINITY_DN12469_c0_g1_i1.p1 TRINITY_DN12469_c0_g1~~TRINITY_DN12469_c0_g1_i1.p1  ORF type:complete len:673 (+),score=154.77 TRINITY_DN12469_c0_g1_i1:112-2130(+)